MDEFLRSPPLLFVIYIYISVSKIYRGKIVEKRGSHILFAIFFVLYCSEIVKEATLFLHFQKWDNPTLVLNTTKPKQNKIRLYLVCPIEGLYIILMTHSVTVRILSIDHFRYKNIGSLYCHLLV
jgi:hypothetical protein